MAAAEMEYWPGRVVTLALNGRRVTQQYRGAMPRHSGEQTSPDGWGTALAHNAALSWPAGPESCR